MSALSDSSIASAAAATLVTHAAPALTLDGLPRSLLNKSFNQHTDNERHDRVYYHVPTLFRHADYLWSEVAYRTVCDMLRPGWWADPAHPFAQCKGQVRQLTTHTRRTSSIGLEALASGGGVLPHLETVSQRTVGEWMSIRGKTSFVMSDISPYHSVETTAAFLWLHRGPALFQEFNLLTATPTAGPDHDPALTQFNIASRGSHTNTHMDWYGADAAAYLTEGEKLWLIAPPHHSAKFHELFPPTSYFDIESADAAAKFGALDSLGGCIAIHQRAGDMIYVPAGWVHCVVNLTFAVSIGYSYLRPWRLAECLQWAESVGEEEAMSMANLSGVFDVTLVDALPINQTSMRPVKEPPFWGISQKKICEYREAWGALKRLWSAKRKATNAQKQQDAASVQVATALQGLSASFQRASSSFSPAPAAMEE